MSDSRNNSVAAYCIALVSYVTRDHGDVLMLLSNIVSPLYSLCTILFNKFTLLSYHASNIKKL
jgi:hypothetical protein